MNEWAVVINICVCVCVSCLVMSNSLQPHSLQATRSLSPRDSPGKNTGVGCHFLLLTNIRVTSIKNLPAVRETLVQSLDWEDLLEKGMATHPDILAWKIARTEETGGLQSMGSQRVGQDWVRNTFTFFVLILLSTETLPYVKSLLLHVFLRNSQGIFHVLSVRVLFYSAQAPTLYHTYL